MDDPADRQTWGQRTMTAVVRWVMEQWDNPHQQGEEFP